MNGNLFDRLDSLSRGQEQGNEKLDEILSEIRQMNNADSAPQSIRQPTKAEVYQTIMQFVFRAEKTVHFNGSNLYFKSEKKATVITGLIMILVGILSAFSAIFNFGMYSTYTFIENIWIVCVISLLFKIGRTPYIFDPILYADSIPMKKNYDMYGLPEFCGSLRFKYRFIKILASISAVLNVVVGFEPDLSFFPFLFMTVSELIFVCFSFYFAKKAAAFFKMYDAIYLSGFNNKGTERITLVKVRDIDSLYTYNEYQKSFLCEENQR